MNHTPSPQEESTALSREELLSALFANLVIQQTNMAMMLLGKVPHPETGESIRDLQSAKLIIDQLEMLETKTKNNLTKQEESLLKQSLMSLRLSFVDSVDNPTPASPSTPHSKSPPSAQTQGQTASGAAASTSSPAPAATAEEESRKKFSKRY